MILRNGFIVQNNQLVRKDILIQKGKIVKIEDHLDVIEEELDCSGCLILPGATDVHVHLREPGYSYKETIHSGTMSAAKGGITSLCAMPNLNPVPDSLAHLEEELKIISKTGVVHVAPYGALSIGQKGANLADLEEMHSKVIAFTDDGFGVNNIELLISAMKYAQKYDFLICSHAEDAVDGKLPQGEYNAVRREIALAKKIKCRYHFCHLSCKESFDEIRKAHQEGYTNITCEVTPHHLFLNEMMIQDGNWKMNPPLRSEENRQATIEALLDGTASIIASDHAPHSEEEKNKPYASCPNGIIGLETMLPLVYTHLIHTKKASLNDFIRWFVDEPNRIFRLPQRKLEEEQVADITCLDIVHWKEYKKSEILSLGKNSPYIGMKLLGFPQATFVNGNLVWRDESEA